MKQKRASTRQANQKTKATPLSKASRTGLAGIRRRIGIPEREDAQFKSLVKSLSQYLNPAQIEEVEKAYIIGANAHDGQRRLEGEKYINHPLAVAALLAELKLDSSTIIAAILHDTLEDTHLTKAEMATEFGTEVAELVDSVSKIDKLKFDSPQHAEAENLRRMFLASASDLRVILIKMADRLHNLDSLHVHRVEKRQRIVNETRDIYIPIAHMLGMGNWQRKMQELCFKALHPERYKVIHKAVRSDLKQSVEQTVKKHTTTIRKLLEEKEIRAEVVGRFKETSAIHEKMRKKGNALRMVPDLFAFRIIVKNVDDCYRALGLIHNLYKPISGEFNDYIAIPKMNGYQSLHTTVHGNFGRAIEVQIRTEEMHRIAESGIASHLSYKTGNATADDTQLPGVKWLNEVINSLEEHESPAEYLENLKLKLFPDYVYVFTPKGDIKRLKKGSTVIDYAYSIHSAVGNGAKSAKIDDHPVALHTVLKNGDRVEITKSRFSRPDPAWLNFAVTGDARTAIRRALKEMSSKELVKMGERIFKGVLKKYKIKQSTVSDAMKEELVDRLGAESWSDILREIGTGERFAAAVIGQIFPATFLDSNSKSSQVISIQGTEGLGVQYAKCCNPIPKEPIVGVFNRGRGIVIHIQDCPNVRQSKLSPENWQKLNWAKNPKGQYRVTLLVSCQNETGLLADVSSRISRHDADITHCFTRTSKSDAALEYEIEVKDTEHLNAITQSILRHNLVNRVDRVKLN